MQTFSSLSAVFLYKYHKSCGCGESIRGLQNLGAPGRANFPKGKFQRRLCRRKRGRFAASPGGHAAFLCCLRQPTAACGGQSLVAAATIPAASRLFFGEKAAERPQDRSAFASLFAFAQIRLNLRKIDLVIRHTVLDGIRRYGTHAFAHTDADRHHAEV